MEKRVISDIDGWHDAGNEGWDDRDVFRWQKDMAEIAYEAGAIDQGDVCGKTLVLVRALQSISLREAAEGIGITAMQLSEMENGKRPITIDAVEHYREMARVQHEEKSMKDACAYDDGYEAGAKAERERFKKCLAGLEDILALSSRSMHQSVAYLHPSGVEQWLAEAKEAIDGT